MPQSSSCLELDTLSPTASVYPHPPLPIYTVTTICHRAWNLTPFLRLRPGVPSSPSSYIYCYNYPSDFILRSSRSPTAFESRDEKIMLLSRSIDPLFLYMYRCKCPVQLNIKYFLEVESRDEETILFSRLIATGMAEGRPL
jgi:hypothetical protein